jgi:NhaP-type Na+/H+ or K+/H+ antiporter
MTQALLYITFIAVILLFGLLCTLISNKLRISNVLLLILTGMLLGNTPYKGGQLISFPTEFLAAISIIALAVVVFDGSSRLKFRYFDTLSLHAMKLTSVFMLLNLFLLAPMLYFFTDIDSIALCSIFAILMVGSAPDVVMTMVHKKSSKILNLLKIEGFLNTPLIVLFPFMILDFLETTGGTSIIISNIIEQIAPFFQQIVAGIGAGVVIGMILFKIMSRFYSDTLSPLSIIAAALLSYILAENLGGNGVLGVMSAGLIFGNLHIKQKVELQEFAGLFATFLEILVFVLVGVIVKVPLTTWFFISSITLFGLYLIIRYFAIQISFKETFNLKEKIFLTLITPKGIAVATIVFSFTTITLDGMTQLLNLIMIFMIYSILVSTIAMRFKDYFLEENVKKQ